MNLLHRFISAGRRVDGRSDVWYVFLIITGWVFAYFHGLDRPVSLWDETAYMTAAQFAVERGYWIVPHVPYNGWSGPEAIGVQPFLLKPPFAIWLQAASMELFGVSPAAGRLPAVVCTLLLAVLTYRVGRTIYSRNAGFVAAVVVLSVTMVFENYHGGRSAAMDVPMLLFGTLAVYATFLGVRRDVSRIRLFSVAGLAVGIAILTKGFNAGIFAFIVLPLVLIHWRAFLSRGAFLGVSLAVLVPLSWFAVVELLHDGMVVSMFYEQVLNRVAGEKISHPGTFGFMNFPYFRTAPTLFAPWWFLFLAALVTVPLGVVVRRGRSRLTTETGFVCWWSLVVFAFFVPTGNHRWYLMPMVVPMGLLCGRLLDRGFRPGPEAAGIAVGVWLTMMQTAAVGDALALAPVLSTIPEPAARASMAIGVLGVHIAVVYRSQWAGTISSLTRIDARCLTVGKRVFIASLIVIVLVQVPFADTGWRASEQQERVADELHSMTAPDTPVYVHSSADVSIYAFVFHAERPLRSVTIDEINTDPSVEYVLINESETARIDRLHSRVGSMSADYFGPYILLRLNQTSASSHTQPSLRPLEVDGVLR
ncbi:ArnT family glycosyltransferase [Halocatena pleomorpha]|uniref:Phospholipid carrier-dependent glycosyltransferase n=1 Tax=Halocatena pleomorpha TaxID=1785090 RepID=A0A3P3RC26_9EURY|nr:glycosyltransferase family 39 protein [Halocatena pleomorpha]RRJ31016.1 phospholipid carrier-dependent glycosyltransferase [Halocatena pleomorpha]